MKEAGDAERYGDKLTNNEHDTNPANLTGINIRWMNHESSKNEKDEIW
jgi:hypothetical protein